jgi:hypothetical protein
MEALRREAMQTCPTPILNAVGAKTGATIDIYRPWNSAAGHSRGCWMSGQTSNVCPPGKPWLVHQ